MDGENGLCRFLNTRGTDIRLDEIELVEHIDEFIEILADRRDRRFQDITAEVGRNFNDHSIIDENDASVGSDDNVSRMRVRMKETVNQELIDVELDQVLDHPIDIDVVPADFLHIGDTETLIELHHEHA